MYKRRSRQVSLKRLSGRDCVVDGAVGQSTIGRLTRMSLIMAASFVGRFQKKSTAIPAYGGNMLRILVSKSLNYYASNKIQNEVTDHE